jgi:hypothetical protein
MFSQIQIHLMSLKAYKPFEEQNLISQDEES